MKTLRQVHLYLGCFFAPLILYFSLSGIWQEFRFNDLPRSGANPPAAEARARQPRPEVSDEVLPATGSSLRRFLHELSKPHTSSTMPGREPRERSSVFFKYFAAAMGLGLTVTTLLGLVLAFRYGRPRPRVLACALAGTGLPLVALWLGHG